MKRIFSRDGTRPSMIGLYLVAAFMLLTIALGWSGMKQLRAHQLERAVAQLQAVNQSVGDRLATESARMQHAAALMVANTPFQQRLLAVVDAAAGREQRWQLRRIMAPWFIANGYSDVKVFRPDGSFAAGMREEIPEQSTHIPSAIKTAFQQALAGEALLTHPFMRGDETDMWLMVPFHDHHGDAGGIVALELGADQHFGKVTTASSARFGESAETYLVDRDARLLSASRFERQLQQKGLLKADQSSVLHVRIVDPATGKPTFAMANLLEQPDGLNVEGYADYRGVPVIGFWQWNRALDAGIISEIDLSVALEDYHFARNLFALLLAILLLVGLIISRSYARYRRTVERDENALRNLLLESTAEAIYGVDMSGRCTFANRACVNLLGYDSDADLLGHNMHQLIHHSHADGQSFDEQLCGIFRSFRNKTRVHCRSEVFWRRDGSAIPVEYWSHPLFNEDGSVLGGVVTFLDLTELRKAEDQRNKIEQQIQHSQRLESLGVLAGGIAHDFNNLLSAILGNAALASRKVVNDPIDAREKLEKIVQSCDHAAVLCRQMLAYSGKGKFVVKPVNLSAMVEEVTHLLQVSIDKSTVIKYHLPETLPLVEADLAQMQQLIMNLVTNANEAIGGKSGVISISTGVMFADAAYLLDCYGDQPKPGRYCYVEVSDTGCGMDHETLKKIFDPFFTTKFTGRGLGMSAVLGIVRGHEGALKVYSEVGKGTTFKYLIPAGEQLIGIDEHAEAEDNNWQGKGLVLVVDDEEAVRETAMMMLEDMGFETIAAVNGLEAIEIYRKRKDEITLVLMDLTMPKMGGEACFRELRRLNPDVKVVLSSGYNEQDAIQTFTGKRLAGFVQKPVSPERLAHMVREVLEGDDA